MAAAAMTTAMTAVLLETRPRRASRCRARAASISGAGAAAFSDPRCFRELGLERATTVTCPALVDHRRLYIRLAAASARVHPARFPCASSRLARAKVAANAACACCSARLTEAGVG
jgi:hypothetical protein